MLEIMLGGYIDSWFAKLRGNMIADWDLWENTILFEEKPFS